MLDFDATKNFFEGLKRGDATYLSSLETNKEGRASRYPRSKGLILLFRDLDLRSDSVYATIPQRSLRVNARYVEVWNEFF